MRKGVESQKAELISSWWISSTAPAPPTHTHRDREKLSEAVSTPKSPFYLLRNISSHTTSHREDMPACVFVCVFFLSTHTYDLFCHVNTGATHLNTKIGKMTKIKKVVLTFMMDTNFMKVPETTCATNLQNSLPQKKSLTFLWRFVNEICQKRCKRIPQK